MRGGHCYLAFETGGSKLVAALAAEDGRLRRSVSIKRADGDRAPRSFGRLVRAAGELLASERGGRARLRSIGFGFGGTVRRSTNSPHVCLHEEGWNEVDVVGELVRRFAVPVFVENDCKLAALAEAHFGAGRPSPSVFYVTLGTGVGGGFVRDGQIVPFGDLGEAEIGHVVVDPDGPECCCGNAGCVEAICSGPGLVRLAELLAERSPALSAQSSLISGTGAHQPMDSHRIIAAWEAGDAFADRVMRHSAAGLATALGAVVNLMVPGRIVVGGGLGTSTPRLLELVRAETACRVVPYFRDSYSIVASSLRVNAVTQGAAVLARQRCGAGPGMRSMLPA